MRATRFEFRHQTLLHLLVVGLSLVTYLADPDDIVWVFVRNHSDSASWLALNIPPRLRSRPVRNL